MSVLNVSSQVWTAGSHNLGPVNKPANSSLISFLVAAPTDWQTGASGRTVDLLVQFSTDSGVTWRDRAEGTLVTPQMGKAGAFPTLLEVDVSGDATGTQYRGVLTLSANLTAGWTVTVA